MKGFGIRSWSLRAVLKTMLSPGVPVISVGEAALQVGTAVFLDARERDEYAVSHVAGAVWIGFSDFTLTRLKDIPFTQRVIVYCSVGKRSDVVARRLLQAGYLNVYNLVGGIIEWVNQGQSVYNNGKATANVHVYNPFWGCWLRQGNKKC